MLTNAQVLSMAQADYEKYRANMESFMGVADPGVTFVIDTSIQNVAETNGTVISLNPKLLNDGINNGSFTTLPPGLIVHEMTHAFLQDPSYSGHDAGKGGNQEGHDEAFADYMRSQLVGDNGAQGEPGWALSPHGNLFSKMEINQVRAAAADMRAGTFTDEMMHNPGTIPGATPGTTPGAAAASPAPSPAPTAGTGGAVNDPVYQAYLDVLKTAPATATDIPTWWQGLSDKDKRSVVAAINQATPGQNFGINSPLNEIAGGVQATNKVIGYDPTAAAGAGGGGGGTGTGFGKVPTVPQGGTTGVGKPGDYMTDLNGLGLPMNNELRDLINRTQDKTDPLYNATTKEFENAVRHTDTYAKFYPGIIGANGQQLMSESAYNSMARDYKGVAGANGLSIGRNEVGHLISQNISLDEFRTRAQAIQKIEQYRPAFQQFNATLKAMGMQPLDEAGIQKFVMGEASPEFYKVWNEAATRTAVVSAGIKIGPQATSGKLGDVSLSRHDIKQIEGATGGQASPQQMADLAQKLQTLLPQSRIQKMGLDREDLTQLEFGGPRQARAYQVATQIMANQAAREKGQGQGYQTHQQLGARNAGQNEGF